jgi:hypothetical protein
MFELRRGMSLLLAAGALLSVMWPVFADTQDDVARNLLERQQRENDFHVRLYDNTPPRPISRGPTLPLPLETAPRSVLDLGPPLPPNPTSSHAVTPQASDAGQQLQLSVSQQQRLQQLQLQNQNLPEPVRQQQQQIQQLQFDRENQAQGLHDQIMRDSQGSMRQVR